MSLFELDEKSRIIKAKVSLNKHRPFFSYILMNMKIEQSEDNKYIPTMGVNQYGDLFWNKEFVSKLNQPELEGVLGHEAMHCATLTFSRKKNRDHMLWNIATDLVINYILIKEGFIIPQGVMLPTKSGDFTFTGKGGKKVTINIEGKVAEEVYDMLSNHAEIIKVNFASDDGDGKQGQGGYKGQLDSHIPGDKDSKGKDSGKGKHEADVHANSEDWKKKASEALTTAKMRGNCPADLQRELEGLLNPKIDWRKKLAQYITKEIPVDFTMQRPGRRFYSTGVYYPSVIRENLQIIAGVDTSGSIGGDELKEFFSELLGVCNGFAQINLRVIGWGTDVHPKDDILINNNTKQMLYTIKLHGGGGTEMSSFTRYIEKQGYNSRVYILLTDGYIEDKPKLPEGANILFVISKNGSDEICKKYGCCCKLSDVEQCMTDAK